MSSLYPRPGPSAVAKDRLDSWKEIAAYLQRDIRTVQRWERDLGLPVQRLPGGPKAGVFASRHEIDAWMRARTSQSDALAEEDEGKTDQLPKPLWRRRVLWIGSGTLLVVLVALAGFRFPHSRDSRLLFVQQSHFTPFATSAGVQVCPAWSPDGKNIAFIGKVSDLPQLFVQAVDNSTPIAVTPPLVLLGGADATWCRAPIWSPDSHWLYFLGNCSGKRALCRVSAGGGEPALVQESVIAATLSPDGKTVAVLSAHEPDKKLRVYTATPPEGPLRRYEPPPVEAASFVHIPSLAFAPDGRSILLAISKDAASDYRLLPWPEGSSRRVMQSAERVAGSPALAWMPDSTHIVFGGPILGIANLGSGRYWPIAIQPHDMRKPSPSPEGSRVVFQSSLSHADVVSLPLDGGPVQTLLGSSRTEQQPSASRVAPQIAYVTNKRRPAEIWIKDLVQGWDRPLISPGDVKVRGERAQFLLAPEFSPDGRQLAFSAVSPAGSEAFTMVIDGGIPVRVRDTREQGEISPTWSPDGKEIAFLSSVDRTLMKVRLGDSGPGVPILARNCRAPSLPEWSPAGDWIVVVGEGCDALLVSPGGEEKRPIGPLAAFAWSRDGAVLYGFDMFRRALVAVDPATGGRKLLRQVDDLMPYSVMQPGLRASVSSDGARLIYTVLSPREEIWIMENVRIDEPWYSWLIPAMTPGP